MQKKIHVLAIDLGASNGRAFLGRFADQKLEIEEIHRFENRPLTVNEKLCWDFDSLWDEIKTSLKKAHVSGGFDSVAIDTWGVDYGFLDREGKLSEMPVHYRDNRTDSIPEQVFRIISDFDLYRLTGNQILKINTLFQLIASKKESQFEQAQTLLFMPDLFGFFLSGNLYSERSIASTSQMFNPVSLSWENAILTPLGIPRSLLQDVIPSGTIVGELRQELCRELNIPQSKVIAAAGHDTQCAIAALPSNAPDIAFLSCGTWSLFGTELDSPVLTYESMKDDMSNELGANGKIDYLKNINGLWLIQECRREWRKENSCLDYSEIERMANESEPFRSFIDPDDDIFSSPGDFPQKIQAFCTETGQTVPTDIGAIARCIYESLALKYRYTLDQIQKNTGKKHTALHIVGGGVQSRILCQFASDSLGIPVYAGPIEATVFGNMMIQLTALGAIQNIQSGRSIIAESVQIQKYVPHEQGKWNAAYQQFLRMINKENAS